MIHGFDRKPSLVMKVCASSEDGVNVSSDASPLKFLWHSGLVCMREVAMLLKSFTD